MNNYKSALDKIKANEEFKAQTLVVLKSSKYKKNKNRRAVGVIAASLAVVIALGAILFPAGTGGTNSFVLTANAAAELTHDFSTVADIVEFDHYIWWKIKNNRQKPLQINSEINFNLTCNGRNIDKITYSVANGAFILRMNAFYSAVDTSEYKGKKSGLDVKDIVYSSYEVDYKNQPECETDGNNTVAPVILYVWQDVKKNQSEKIKKYLSSVKNEKSDKISYVTARGVFNEMLKNTIVTVTVKYKDGSEESCDIKFKVVIEKDCDDYKLAVKARVV